MGPEGYFYHMELSNIRCKQMCKWCVDLHASVSFCSILFHFLILELYHTAFLNHIFILLFFVKY